MICGCADPDEIRDLYVRTSSGRQHVPCADVRMEKMVGKRFADDRRECVCMCRLWRSQSFLHSHSLSYGFPSMRTPIHTYSRWSKGRRSSIGRMFHGWSTLPMIRWSRRRCMHLGFARWPQRLYGCGGKKMCGCLFIRESPATLGSAYVNGWHIPLLRI